MMNNDPDNRLYRAVVNDEQQYSVWPEGKPLPLGWRECGMTGTKGECIQHIEKVWTDMRPKSLQLAMQTAKS